jgi:DNA-directed RNA polymerase sigma subunit (sigma70/sigma32)
LVVELRFGLSGGCPRSLQQVGEQLSLTKERVRQIEVAALKKMRARERVA